jgi:3,4-dihydroxy 2-butanone 4-phosphate synthase / GTP cyclohydrolase II
MHNIEQALEQFQMGGMVVVVDDEARENEGDLIVAAEKVTPEAIAFMARQGCGLVCLALTGTQLDRLGIPLMVPAGRSGDAWGTAFTVSIEAAADVTTGISAADRARTVWVASNPASAPGDIVMPGHMFPLRACAGGVLERPGHTEAAVELARLAGLWPAGVICEIMADDGTMMRLPDLRVFARQHELPLISIAELVAYQQANAACGPALEERTVASPCEVEWLATSHLPTPLGIWQLHAFRDLAGRDQLALVMGEVDGEGSLLTRLHSECLTGDVLGSLRCDCGAQLEEAMRCIAQEGQGVLLYLRQEGRGIGLANKIRAYALQDQGLDTVEANERLGFPVDGRDYSTAAAMLRYLGVNHVRLLTNNPRKQVGLQARGVTVAERVPLETARTVHNHRYLTAKQHKLGHLFTSIVSHA